MRPAACLLLAHPTMAQPLQSGARFPCSCPPSSTGTGGFILLANDWYMSIPRRGSVPIVPRLAAIALASSAVVACGHAEPTPPKDPPKAPTSAAAIPVAPLSGKLLGEPFAIKSARYYVDQRPGYKKIILKLYGVESSSPCKDLTPLKAPEVWLRHDGPERIKKGQTTIDLDGKAPWQVHYQIQKDGRWVGNGAARALFVVTQVAPDMKVHGELTACFRDATGSCVAGVFVANYCRIWIDSPVRGSDVMEHPTRHLPEDTPDVVPPPSALPSVPPSGAPGAAPTGSAAPAASASAAPTGSSAEPHR